MHWTILPLPSNSQVSRGHAKILSAPKSERQRSDDIRLANDGNAVNRRSAAGEEAFARNSVAGNDPVQLVLGRAQMLADQFSEHGTIIIRTLQIPVAGPEHRTSLAGHPGHGIV